jgi:hypothetical protein
MAGATDYLVLANSNIARSTTCKERQLSRVQGRQALAKGNNISLSKREITHGDQGKEQNAKKKKENTTLPSPGSVCS